MKMTILNQNKVFEVSSGTNLLEALRAAGFGPDAPCGGKGTCGKCKVIANGQEVLACHTVVDRDVEVMLPEEKKAEILTEGMNLQVKPDGTDACVIAYDVGTTTVVAYLMDGKTGDVLAQSSCVNPQTRYGADVISRIQYAMDTDAQAIRTCIADALRLLAKDAAKKAGIAPEAITTACLVGNTAMHHLMLGFDPKPLTVPPYMPSVSHSLQLEHRVNVRDRTCGCPRM